MCCTNTVEPRMKMCMHVCAYTFSVLQCRIVHMVHNHILLNLLKCVHTYVHVIVYVCMKNSCSIYLVCMHCEGGRILSMAKNLHIKIVIISHFKTIYDMLPQSSPWVMTLLVSFKFCLHNFQSHIPNCKISLCSDFACFFMEYDHCCFICIET